MWPRKEPFEVESPLPPAECYAILAARFEPWQLFGPWSLDQPFKGEVTKDSICLSCGRKPYPAQPMVKATLSPSDSGTIIKGFLVARSAPVIYFSTIFVIVIVVASCIAGAYLATPLLPFFAVSSQIEKHKANTDKRLLIEDLTRHLYLKLTAPPIW